MQIKQVPLSRITPYHRNPRNAADAVPGVMKSITEFGWRQPIVVDKEMVIIVGHARYLAAQRLGCVRVPVHVADDLPADKVAAYRLADNRSHEEATWNDDLLRLELVDLRELGGDLAFTGFDERELTKLLAPPKTEAGPQLGKLAYSVVIRCADEKEQQRLLERFAKEGRECQALIS
jgi:ParB-like chromosome segregation protein Spo0J